MCIIMIEIMKFKCSANNYISPRKIQFFCTFYLIFKQVCDYELDKNIKKIK